MNKIIDKIHIPKDVTMKLPLIRLLGNQELYIENYRGILEYTDSLIRVQTKLGQIHIIGKGLEVIYYASDEMKIRGYIESLTILQGDSIV